MINGGPVDDGSERDSERENGEGSVSFRSVSTATPVKNAKRKIRKIKKMVSENQQNKANTNGNTHRSDEVRLRIQAKIEEQKNAVRLKHQQEQQEQDRPQRESSKKQLRDNDTAASSTPSAMMALLSDDIGEMELEMQRLLQELESAKEDMSTATKQQKRKQQQKQKQAAKQETVDEEFLVGRITELEVENEILQSRLQSGQATVDSIRNDITNMASSNQECRKALREAKERVRPLQLEQESLRAKVQQAEEELQALETKAAYKRTVRQVEMDQKEVFEKAAREILDLQRNLRLKKQISQRKLQQRVQEKKQKQQLRQQMMQEHVQQKLFQHEPIQTTKSMEPVQRTIKRQSSWWQLDASPEKPPSLAQVRSQSFHVASREVSRDSTLGTNISEDSEIDSSDLDTLSASSDIDFSHRKVE